MISPERCPACTTRVRLRRPDLAIRCRCGAVTRSAAHALPVVESAPERLPTRAEALAWVAAGVYDAPAGMRFELDAWALVSSESWEGLPRER